MDPQQRLVFFQSVIQRRCALIKEPARRNLRQQEENWKEEEEEEEARSAVSMSGRQAFNVLFLRNV